MLSVLLVFISAMTPVIFCSITFILDAHPSGFVRSQRENGHTVHTLALCDGNQRNQLPAVGLQSAAPCAGGIFHCATFRPPCGKSVPLCWLLAEKPQPLIPFFSKATFLLDIAYDMLLVGSIRPFSVGEVRGGVANAKPALYSHVEKQTLALPSSVFQCSGLSHCLCPPPLWLP